MDNIQNDATVEKSPIKKQPKSKNLNKILTALLLIGFTAIAFVPFLNIEGNNHTSIFTVILSIFTGKFAESFPLTNSLNETATMLFPYIFYGIIGVYVLLIIFSLVGLFSKKGKTTRLFNNISCILFIGIFVAYLALNLMAFNQQFITFGKDPISLTFGPAFLDIPMIYIGLGFGGLLINTATSKNAPLAKTLYIIFAIISFLASTILITDNYSLNKFLFAIVGENTLLGDTLIAKIAFYSLCAFAYILLINNVLSLFQIKNKKFNIIRFTLLLLVAITSGVLIYLLNKDFVAILLNLGLPIILATSLLSFITSLTQVKKKKIVAEEEPNAKELPFFDDVPAEEPVKEEILQPETEETITVAEPQEVTQVEETAPIETEEIPEVEEVDEGVELVEPTQTSLFDKPEDLDNSSKTLDNLSESLEDDESFEELKLSNQPFYKNIYENNKDKEPEIDEINEDLNKAYNQPYSEPVKAVEEETKAEEPQQTPFNHFNYQKANERQNSYNPQQNTYSGYQPQFIQNPYYNQYQQPYAQPYVYDSFMNILTLQERDEFDKLFISKIYGENKRLPDYIVGGNNSEFFNKVFVFLGRYRHLISDSLLEKIYNFSNNLR